MGCENDLHQQNYHKQIQSISPVLALVLYFLFTLQTKNTTEQNDYYETDFVNLRDNLLIYKTHSAIGHLKTFLYIQDRVVKMPSSTL